MRATAASVAYDFTAPRLLPHNGSRTSARVMQLRDGLTGRASRVRAAGAHNLPKIWPGFALAQTAFKICRGGSVSLTDKFSTLRVICMVAALSVARVSGARLALISSAWASCLASRGTCCAPADRSIGFERASLASSTCFPQTLLMTKTMMMRLEFVF